MGNFRAASGDSTVVAQLGAERKAMGRRAAHRRRRHVERFIEIAEGKSARTASLPGLGRVANAGEVFEAAVDPGGERVETGGIDLGHDAHAPVSADAEIQSRGAASKTQRVQPLEAHLAVRAVRRRGQAVVGTERRSRMGGVIRSV